MRLTDKIQQAINVATTLHDGQKRKTEQLPYIVHPFSVAIILSEYTDDEDVICAGLLHDVLEDVPSYSYETLVKDFGARIAGIVKEVSEDKDPKKQATEDRRANWLERKKGYISHLENASAEAVLVSAADKISNLSSLLEAIEKYGKKVYESFNASQEQTIWFYDAVSKTISEKLGGEVSKRLAEAVEKLRKFS